MDNPDEKKGKLSRECKRRRLAKAMTAQHRRLYEHLDGYYGHYLDDRRRNDSLRRLFLVRRFFNQPLHKFQAFSEGSIQGRIDDLFVSINQFNGFRAFDYGRLYNEVKYILQRGARAEEGGIKWDIPPVFFESEDDEDDTEGYLGGYEIRLRINTKLSTPSTQNFMVVKFSSGAEYAYSDRYCHPHVNGGWFCTGDGLLILSRAVLEGRLSDAMDIAESLVRTYSPDTRYHSLRTCFGERDRMAECAGCGHLAHEEWEHWSRCDECSSHVCDECVRYCAACASYYCQDHDHYLAECAQCHDAVNSCQSYQCVNGGEYAHLNCCFKCVECNEYFIEDDKTERDGEPYCPACAEAYDEETETPEPLPLDGQSEMEFTDGQS